MKYIFGPVLSRRFGKSIGVDVSPDKKQCNFDCLYCEVGKEKTVPQIENPPQVKEIISELEDFLKTSGYPDVITVTASGEPTLYPFLDQLISSINRIKKDSKTLILSNGSTINKPEVREVLKKFDIVKLSLDAADQRTFKKINRVIDGIHVNEIIKGMESFRNEFKGQLVVEVLFVRGVNDSIENIKRLSEVLREIKPDRLDIGTVDRPPAYMVNPLTDRELLEIAQHFKGINTNVITRGKDSTIEKIDISEKQIIQTFRRRPYTYQDIQTVFGEETIIRIKQMIKEGKLEENLSNNEIFITPSVTN
ncbi:radical SAM protein [Persephonella atlantica]|uniref:Radical SAM protein n=1 Tax=Persephonella atlantica TaxID=2699429 RepID=A0ABS1GF36_9AQUI|nr:radical SAM protein [Persephonella atlantica]MBK3331547.1 radical SAM protein [Persephonella atlantica]